MRACTATSLTVCASHLSWPSSRPCLARACGRRPSLPEVWPLWIVCFPHVQWRPSHPRACVRSSLYGCLFLFRSPQPARLIRRALGACLGLARGSFSIDVCAVLTFLCTLVMCAPPVLTYLLQPTRPLPAHSRECRVLYNIPYVEPSPHAFALGLVARESATSVGLHAYPQHRTCVARPLAVSYKLCVQFRSCVY